VASTAWGRRKAAALVKFLALAPGHRLTRDEVVDRFWPDLDPPAAVNNLYQALHTARRAFAAHGGGLGAAPDGPALTLRRNTVALDPPGGLWIDVEAFETAAAGARRAQDPEAYHAALELYSGDLLPEDAYEEWAGPRRDGLRQTHLALLLEAAALLEAGGAAAAAVTTLQRAVAADATCEAAHAALMRLYARTGRRAQALHQYAQLQTALRRELDAAPDPATRRLYQSLMAGQPAAEVAPAPPGTDGDSPAAVQPPCAAADRVAAANNLPLPATTFIGRGRDVAALRRLLTPTITPAQREGAGGRVGPRAADRPPGGSRGAPHPAISPDAPAASAGRLVTLVGPGGAGKTRLALAVAAALVRPLGPRRDASSTSPVYPDGVWLVDLAPLADPALVPQAVARVLGVAEAPAAAPAGGPPPPGGPRPLAATLADALRPRELLLVLDNCEHLIEACAELAETLLAACQGVRVLATSREPLRAAGEIPWQVPPLALPPTPPWVGSRQYAVGSDDPTEAAGSRSVGDGRGLPTPPAPRAPGCELPTAERLRASEAVQLFLDRARWQPTFIPTDEAVRTVAAICRGLDGLPLAIELAAARLDVLTVDQIAARLDDALRLLTGGRRTAAPRHQTLRAALDWSHALLPGPERALLRRLAVFAAGATLEAVEEVCSDQPGTRETGGVGSSEYAVGDSRLGSAQGGGSLPTAYRLLPTDILDLLGQLIHKSLVVMEPDGDTARYRLLETVRQYATEQLEAAGEAGAVRRRHSAWGVALAERADGAVLGPDQVTWLRRLDAEHANLRAALAWAVAHEPAWALRLVGALGRFWHLRGHLSEGYGWARRALQAGPDAPSPARAGALHAAGWLAWALGDYGRATARLEEEAALRRVLADRRGLAWVLGDLAAVAAARGDRAGAVALGETALAMHREGGDQAGIASGLQRLGILAHERGDVAQAEALYAQALVQWREVGVPTGIASALDNLAGVAQDRGDLARAVALHEEELALRREVGDRLGTANALGALGELATEQGQPGRAIALLEEALALKRAAGARQPVEFTLYQLSLAALALGDRAHAAARALESLAISRELGLPAVAARRLEGLARAVLAGGTPEPAAWLLAAAEAVRAGSGVSPPNPAALERTQAAVRAALAEAAFAAAWAAGRAMTPEAAVTTALRPAARD
jgi:predicted ATPase/DNA-binding SARP family transcriptional activator